MIPAFTASARPLGRWIVRSSTTAYRQYSDKYPIPRYPLNFNKDFSIAPDLFPLPLQLANHHPMDEHLRYDAANREYYFEEIKMKHNITDLVVSFFEKFDEDEVIQKMITSDKWPRPGYLKNSRPMTPDEIKLKWASIGDYARNRRTWMLHNIERCLNGLTPSEFEEYALINRFKRDVLERHNIVPFRTEWKIAGPDVGLAGCVHFIARNPDDTYNIYDWRHAKQIFFSNKFANAKSPIDHVPDCEGMKIALEMNMLRHMLEVYYNITVKSMVVYAFHETSLRKYEIPEMDKEVQAILDTIAKDDDNSDDIVIGDNHSDSDSNSYSSDSHDSYSTGISNDSYDNNNNNNSDSGNETKV